MAVRDTTKILVIPQLNFALEDVPGLTMLSEGGKLTDTKNAVPKSDAAMLQGQPVFVGSILASQLQRRVF